MPRAGIIAAVIFLLPSAAAAADQVEELIKFDAETVSKLSVREAAPGSVTCAAAREGASPALALEFKRVPKAGYANVILPVNDKLAKDGAKYDGIVLKVKGDGSTTYGLVEIRTDGYKNIFQATFPLGSTQWRDVPVRWDEFFQMNDSEPDARMNLAGISNFSFGSRADWGDAKYEVKSIALAGIPARERRRAAAGTERLARSLEKLKEGQPVTIVALGDSITFGTKVPAEERPAKLYFNIVARGLEKSFAGAKVTTVNAGVGGDTIAEGLVRIGHQVAPSKPDLVMVLLGANDAMYGFPDSRVRSTMSELIDRLIESAPGADVLILGPAPISDKAGIPERYDAVFEKLASERNVAYFNLTPPLKALDKADYKNVFADNVHWAAYGHEVVGRAILGYILGLSRE